jgi:hypothetical protein
VASVCFESNFITRLMDSDLSMNLKPPSTIPAFVLSDVFGALTAATASPHSPPDKRKQIKRKIKEAPLSLILPSKKKRVAVALAASSSPFMRAGVPSAWCIQRPRL